MLLQQPQRRQRAGACIIDAREREFLGFRRLAGALEHRCGAVVSESISILILFATCKPPPVAVEFARECVVVVCIDRSSFFFCFFVAAAGSTGSSLCLFSKYLFALRVRRLGFEALVKGYEPYRYS